MATAPAPGFPLPLRNALAHFVIVALDDANAEAALAWLAGDASGTAPEPVRADLAQHHLVEPNGSLVDVHRPHVEHIRAHAGRGLRAAAAFRVPDRARPDDGPVAAAIDRAIALWNERLFFEVHEVLEVAWKRATGDERQALQGLIQIGVALHHHAHGNSRGARTLMREGRERLAPTRAALPTLDGTALLDATASWETALATGTAARDATPPVLSHARR